MLEVEEELLLELSQGEFRREHEHRQRPRGNSFMYLLAQPFKEKRQNKGKKAKQFLRGIIRHDAKHLREDKFHV